MDNNQFYGPYYRKRLMEALRGDSVAAKDLLLHIETALASGTQINPAAVAESAMSKGALCRESSAFRCLTNCPKNILTGDLPCCFDS